MVISPTPVLGPGHHSLAFQSGAQANNPPKLFQCAANLGHPVSYPLDILPFWIVLEPVIT